MTSVALSTQRSATREGYSFAAVVRSQLRDRQLDVSPTEGQKERRLSDTLAATIPAAARKSGAFVLPPRAELLPGQSNLAATTLSVEQVIRPETVLSRLGARRVELGTGYGGRRLVSPSRVSVGWVNPETLESTTSRTIAFGESAIKPREGSVRVDVTRSFLRNATEAEKMLRDVLAEAHESEAERVQIAGSGDGMEPMGILAAADAGAVPSAAGSITYAGLTGALQLALDAGARLRASGYLLSLADFEAASALERAGGHPALVETMDGHRLGGRPVEFSPWLPTGFAICGEFAQLGIYYQGLPQLLVNPYTRAAHQVTEISVFDTYDVAIVKPGLLRVITA